MSLNILDLIKGQLGPALISQAAAQLGESESATSKAVGGLLPTVLGGLANNANNPSVLQAITGAASSGLLSNLLGGSTGNSWVSNVLTSIFGDKVGSIVNAISSYAGISNSSSSSLLNMVTGATLGSVGKYAADHNLDASGVSNLLADQKGIVSSLLPAGLSLASLGFGNWFGGSESTHAHATPAEKVTVSTPEEPVEVSRGGATHIIDDQKPDGVGSIWKWLLPLLLLLLAGWFLWKQCQKKEAMPTGAPTDSIVVETDTITNGNDTTTITRVDEDIDLNGTALKGYKGGLEDRMITFLKTDGYKNAANDDALKTTWYDFDHVNFKMGSSNQLEAGSEGQLENLLAILKAYPDAKIKIGGYTDKVGNEAANVKLSKERAEFIKKWLSDKGVGAQILGADGYGSEFAKVAASASDAERAADRKMSVRFAK